MHARTHARTHTYLRVRMCTKHMEGLHFAMNRIHLVYAHGMFIRVLKAGEQFRWASFPKLQFSAFRVTKLNAQNCHIILAAK